MSVQEQLQVWFMPWAGLEAELRIGPVTFWPYKIAAELKVPDPRLRDYLDRLLASYVDHQGYSVDSVVVCSHGESVFRLLAPSETNDLRVASDALIFSCLTPNAVTAVCQDNRSIGPPSADRYELVGQAIDLEGEGLAIRAGSLLSGGWKVGEIRFPRPWCMGGPFAAPDLVLIGGFDCLCKGGKPQPALERLQRSLEWFRLSHTETHQVSYLSKIVMMAMAFEILLDLPRDDKTKAFARAVQDACASDDSLYVTRLLGKKGRLTYSLAAWWAWDFYELRNAIVHGGDPTEAQLEYAPPGRAWLHHLDVAGLVFWELVTRRLYELGCLRNDLRITATEMSEDGDTEQADQIEAALIAWQLRFNEIHRALGWKPEVGST